MDRKLERVKKEMETAHQNEKRELSSEIAGQLSRVRESIVLSIDAFEGVVKVMEERLPAAAKELRGALPSVEPRLELDSKSSGLKEEKAEEVEDAGKEHVTQEAKEDVARQEVVEGKKNAESGD